MAKLHTMLVKAALLTGGAFIGALLARWCDQLILARSTRQSDGERDRYAQGLGPLQQTRPKNDVRKL